MRADDFNVIDGRCPHWSNPDHETRGLRCRFLKGHSGPCEPDLEEGAELFAKCLRKVMKEDK